MAFWNLSSVEPKRSFRYKVIFSGQFGEQTNAGSQMSMFAQSVKKPSFKIESKEYQYLNHKFKYPGRLTWDDSSIDFIDPGGSEGIVDVASTLFKITIGAGYQIPTGRQDLKTISKQALNRAVGDIEIHQLNAAGNPIEQWKMYNAMFTTMDFGELKYEGEEFSTVKVTVIYDYATLIDPTTRAELPLATGAGSTIPGMNTSERY